MAWRASAASSSRATSAGSRPRRSHASPSLVPPPQQKSMPWRSRTRDLEGRSATSRPTRELESMGDMVLLRTAGVAAAPDRAARPARSPIPSEGGVPVL
jgi:hypothetical protein